MRFFWKRKEPPNQNRQPYSKEKPELYWGQVVDQMLACGVSPDGHRLYNVRLVEGRTRDDLVSNLERINQIADWDAAVALEARDLIIITDSGKRI